MESAGKSLVPISNEDDQEPSNVARIMSADGINIPGKHVQNVFFYTVYNGGVLRAIRIGFEVSFWHWGDWLPYEVV